MKEIINLLKSKKQLNTKELSELLNNLGFDVTRNYLTGCCTLGKVDFEAKKIQVFRKDTKKGMLKKVYFLDLTTDKTLNQLESFLIRLKGKPIILKNGVEYRNDFLSLHCSTPDTVRTSRIDRTVDVLL